MKQIGIPVIEDNNYRNYYNVIRALGDEPIAIVSEEDIQMMNQLDGILIPGGVDVNPALYHQENTASENINDALDTWEMKVIRTAVELQLPILGICRGEQILNVYFGGTLIQNIDSAKRHARKLEEPDKVHNSEVVKDSFLEDIYQDEKISINSAHHQAVDQLGEGFVVAQYSDDHIVEAIQHTSLPIYAVQWHPERMCLEHKREDTVDGFKIFEFFQKVIEQREA